MYSSTHSLTSAVDEGEWSASRAGRITPRERAPGTHWIRCWVGPRAVLDAVVRRKIPSLRQESNPGTPIVQAVAQCCTAIKNSNITQVKKNCPATVGPCCLHSHPEDGRSMTLRNVGIPSQHYTASQPRRPRPEHRLVSGNDGDKSNNYNNDVTAFLYLRCRC
jgi:hypothetical protein